MSLRPAKNLDEDAAWVFQATFEAEDLRGYFMLPLVDLNRFPAILDPLEEGTEAPYQSMTEGTCLSGRQGLPLMELARKHADGMLFHILLKKINETHRSGLGVEGANE